ncbi:MAG: DUF89 family protein [Kiritimatiellae bacterium]|nr:DUF89 family protein [Kiritimatiellia bacterium]MBP5791383.1 DUF89 family protein [Kiritimatiellia bacterium]
MRACKECISCLGRNARELARRSARGDEALERRIADEGMRILADAEADGFTLPPPCYARRLIDNALSSCNGAVPDPWAKEKADSTELAKRLLEKWECQKNQLNTNDTNVNINLCGSVALCENNPANPVNPVETKDFEHRLRLAIAGNILDFSIYADLDIAAAMGQMATAFEKPICGEIISHRDTEAQRESLSTNANENPYVSALRKRMDEARSILWIFDNCGEAVFDRLLLEPYRAKVTLAVRGRPAFNDMTRAELAASGYPDGWAGGGVVSNDDGIPGVVDATCGAEFRATFAAADLVVAKGQANFETMNERTDKPIAFLFLAKCPVVCRTIGAEPGTIQVRLHNFPFSNP